MNTRIEVPPELLEKARYLYERTLTPVDDIAAMLGMSKTPFYLRMKKAGWTPRKVRSATGEFARVLIDGAVTSRDFGCSGAPLPGGDPPAGVAAEPIDRVTLAARLMKMAERHMAAVERVQEMIAPSNPVEAERNARTLAVMGRTMREIQILLRPPQDEAADDSEDDPVSIDSDAFRRELAEKLESLLDAERRRASEDYRGTDAEAD